MYWAMVFDIRHPQSRVHLRLCFSSHGLGFLAGISNVVLTLQLPTLLGLTGITGTFMELMPEILHKIGETKIRSLGLCAAAIVILSIMTFIDHKWGQKSAILKAFCISRNLFVLGTFTGVSYFLNKDLEIPIWQTIGPIVTTIPSPTGPIDPLLSNLLLPSLALFFSMTLEHVAMAKAFGAQHSYSFNASQESVTIGLINVINSIFGGLPVSGGDVARSSVLATSDVKSPLNGIFSSSTVLVSMYALSGTLQYMPAPVVAAVITVATWDQMPPAALINAYWKVWFVDFLHFLLAFNFSMLATPEIGIGLSFGFMIMYTLMRIIFSRPAALVSVDLEERYANDTPPWWRREDRVPSGMQVASLETDVCWLNAERVRRHVLDTVYTYQSGIASSIPLLSRPWNVRRDKHIADLRRRAGVKNTDIFIPRFRTLVLDLTAVSFIDFCGIAALQSIRAELADYGGEEDVDFRFVGLCKGVRETFERAGWKLAGKDEDPEFEEVKGEEDGEMIVGDLVRRDLAFFHLTHAIQFVDSMRGTSFVYEEEPGLKKG